MVVEIRTIVKIGTSSYLGIPPKLMQQLRWNVNDKIAYRYADGRLILERVPVEGLAKVRAGVVDGE